MIIRGELKETHKKRLSSLDVAVQVIVLPRGVTPTGLRTFLSLSKVFPRHKFIMVVPACALSDKEVDKVWQLLVGPNIYVAAVKGAANGSDIARQCAILEKRASSDTKVEAR